MATLRAAEVARRLKKAEALPPVLLAFGPDRGLVGEVLAHVAAFFKDADDPFSVVKLDGPTIASDPARLVDEARTVSLFGGRRLILVRDAGTRELDAALPVLLDEPPTDAVVAIGAGDLKAKTGIAKRVADHKEALAIVCPVDGERDLERMIDDEAATFGLTVEADARAVLRERLGADRAASRGEVTKVCLYAADRGTGGVITLADVVEATGDVSLTSVTEAIDAAFLGQRHHLDTALSGAFKADPAGGQLLALSQRFAHALELSAVDVASGTAPTRAVESMRPPVWGSRKATVARILERWSASRARHAASVIADTTFRTRLNPALAQALIRDTMMRIASAADRR